jgi:hypothetical protein
VWTLSTIAFNLSTPVHLYGTDVLDLSTRSGRGRNMKRPVLFVTMEPPSQMEEEFNAWYDTEHLPERRVMPGFLSASRWVCLEGWPRWLAFYELADMQALATPEYLRVSEANISPWTRRITSRALGRLRVVGEEIADSPPEPWDMTAVARLAMLKYERVAPDAPIAPVAAPPGVIGVRHFRAGSDVWCLIACDRVVEAASVRDRHATFAGRPAKLFNFYAPVFGGPPP